MSTAPKQYCSEKKSRIAKTVHYRSSTFQKRDRTKAEAVYSEIDIHFKVNAY